MPKVVGPKKVILVDDLGLGGVGHDAACVQVAVNQGLAVGHAEFLHLGQGQF